MPIVSGGSVTSGGLPDGGEVGQVVTNTAPGEGDWADGVPGPTGPAGTVDGTTGITFTDRADSSSWLVFVEDGVLSLEPAGGLTGLVTENKAETIAGSDGDAVASWEPVGSGQTLAQADGGKQPLLKRSIVNGLSVVRFDGIDDAIGAAFALTQPCTGFVVAKFNAAWAANAFILDGANLYSGAIFQSAPAALQLYAGASLSGDDSDVESFHLYSYVLDGATSKVWFDGSLIASGDPGAADPGGLTLGNAVDGSGPASIDIAHVVLCQGVLSDDERGTEEALLMSLYGL